MKKRNTTYFIAGVTTLILLGSFSKSFVHAEDKIALDGFGDSKLTSVVPTKPDQAKKECVSFVASFDKPLDKKPSAILDIEKYFVNVWNSVMEVTRLSDKKYRISLTANTEEGCPTIENDSNLTISTYSGKEEDNQKQILPESVTFKATKSETQKTPTLTKVKE